MMTDCDAMVKAGAILALHGALTSDQINAQLGDVLDDRAAVEN